MVTKRSFKAALWAFFLGGTAVVAGAVFMLLSPCGHAFCLPLGAMVCFSGLASVVYGVYKLVGLARYRKEKHRRYAPCPCCGSDFCCESDRCCSYCGEILR